MPGVPFSLIATYHPTTKMIYLPHEPGDLNHYRSLIQNRVVLVDDKTCDLFKDVKCQFITTQKQAEFFVSYMAVVGGKLFQKLVVDPDCHNLFLTKMITVPPKPIGKFEVDFEKWAARGTYFRGGYEFTNFKRTK
mgnify:CR=1 FL=1